MINLILWNSPSCTWEVAAGYSLQKTLVVNHSSIILCDRNRLYCQPDFWVVILLWLGGYGPATKKFWSHSHILPVSLNRLWSIWLISDFHYMPVWSKLTSVVCFLLGSSLASEFYMPMFRNRWNRTGVPKRQHIKFRYQGITQKKTYNIQNMAKVWNQEADIWLQTHHYIDTCLFYAKV
jgi:hypothetical protein